MPRKYLCLIPAHRMAFVLLLSGIHSVAAQDLIFNNSLEQAATITSFSASRDSIMQGESTTVSWTTVSATSCSPSNGAGDWNSQDISLLDGNAQIEISTAGTFTFTLSCDGVTGSQAVAQEVVTVNAIPGPCSSVPLSGTVVSWKDFWLVDFPAPVSDKKFATIPKFGYFAIQFETGNVVDDGKMVSIETTIEDGVRLGSYSKCAGDFDVAPECDFTWGLGGKLRWATNGLPGACQLEANSTYYFNITFTDGFDSSASSCDANNCVTNLDVSNRP